MQSSFDIKTFLIATTLLAAVRAHQRVPPGVNPNTYNEQQQYQQHPPPPPHQQQQFQQHPPQQQQFQQPPPQQQQQFQQPPPQQQQQFQQPPPQQQFQQPPPQQQGHHQPHGQQKVLHREIKNEREHMQEHAEIPIDTSNMSEQELQFHYFKMHDADGNSKLDGCELVKSLIHWHDEANHDHDSGKPIPEAKIFKDDELVNMIDPILQADDKNGDGYIDYPEFVLAQANAQVQTKTE